MRTQREWNVAMVGRSAPSFSPSFLRFLGTNCLTRSCISRAALLVKVTARMLPGATPRSVRYAMREVITRVLPVPAPARISTGPCRVMTASRCCGFSVLRFNIAPSFYQSPVRYQSTADSLFVTKTPVRSEYLKNVSRIVVKVGTGVLTDSRKQPDLGQMEQLAAQIAALRKAGKEVVLVSSGAVGAGMGVLGYSKRPGELA